MSAITGLQTVTNLYGSQVNFTNAESSGNNRQVPVLTTEEVGNAWIPWCDNADQFNTHHMSLKSSDGSLNIAVWQHGDNIRYSVNGVFADNAPNVPGNSNIGQSVALTVNSNGDLTMTAWD
jgi:hypothetical protein